VKYIRFETEGIEKPGFLDSDDNVRDISSFVEDINPEFLESELFNGLKEMDLADFPVIEKNRLVQPVTNVGKFICVGLNYVDHAAESGMPIPDEPVIFMKATSAIQGPYDDVELPINCQKADWEVELGIVIGKQTKYISEKDALSHVAGLCVVNDLSERAFQLEKEGQWVKGKSCDTFGPIGPYMVTLEEIPDLADMNIWLELNGERVQNSNTKNMVFSVPFLVHYISQFMSLQPGDIISTGTPPGVGLGMDPQRWLSKGNTMRLGIDYLGVQEQKVV
jgi:2-keto-4-pentenoate hydratase/2-oxohepta-3-ene-1,7-dioic acid hydratase in catechol pathway